MRRAKENGEAFCVTRPDGANSHYLIMGDSVKQNPKSQHRAELLTFKQLLAPQVLRKPSDYPILQRMFSDFFFDIGAQSFERISALRI